MTVRSLKIIQNDSPLKGEVEYRIPFEGFSDPASAQPRALRSLSQIINNGLCHRCGSCVGICPTGVLGLDDESYPRVKNLSACTDCDLCVKVCPGDEFDFHGFHQQKFGNAGAIDSTHGEFISGFIAHSSDPFIQEHSTSGGLVTEIILHLLETAQIDGAVVIVSDSEKIWRGKPIIARSREEVLKSMKSKYAIAPTNSVLSEIKELPGRYVLVGLPCQIHGYLKAAELDARLKERIVLTIGIFCHAAVEYDGYNIIWDSLGEAKHKAKKFISRVGKHPGTPHLELEDGSLYPVYHPDKKGYRPSSMEIINILYRLYSPARCLTCFDALANFADISIGDPWLPPPDDDVDFYKGWSFALVRNEKAAEICKAAEARDKIKVKQLTRKEALSCNVMMSNEKLWRAVRIIETHKRQGKAVPVYTDYEINLPGQNLKQFVKTEINIFTHMLCFVPKFRAVVLRFFLSDGGYYLLWLNNLRRNVRTALRDAKAKYSRKFFGRR